MARFRAPGPKKRAPQRIQNVELRLYAKAIRLANNAPNEITEIHALHLKLVQWMTNTEKALPMPLAADIS